METLWSGVVLERTYENSNAKDICTAVIITSCDIPAARKLCGHVSTLVSCHRCEKKVNYINKQSNFSGMADIDEWFYMKDLTKHRQNALDWR